MVHHRVLGRSGEDLKTVDSSHASFLASSRRDLEPFWYPVYRQLSHERDSWGCQISALSFSVVPTSLL